MDESFVKARFLPESTALNIRRKHKSILVEETPPKVSTALSTAYPVIILLNRLLLVISWTDEDDLAFSKSSCLRYFLKIEGAELPPGVSPSDKIDIRFKRNRAKGEFYEKQYQRLESDYEKIFMPR